MQEFEAFVSDAQGSTIKICKIADHLGTMLSDLTIEEMKKVEEILTPITTSHQNVYIRNRVEVLIRLTASFRKKREDELKSHRDRKTKRPAC